MRARVRPYRFLAPSSRPRQADHTPWSHRGPSVLTSVVPNTGPAAGTNPVTLNGSQFTGAIAVMFGSAAALSYTVNNPSTITATVPPGTGTVNVTVRTPAGLSNTIAYTYAPTPALSAIAPNQGPTSGGTSVVLTGTGLTGTTAVTFGSTPATSYTVNSATQITAVTPTSAPAQSRAPSLVPAAPAIPSSTPIWRRLRSPRSRPRRGRRTRAPP